MQQISIEQVTFLAGILLANIGVIIGSYVSIVKAIARLEVKVDNLEKDVNFGWEKIRRSNLTEKE